MDTDFIISALFLVAVAVALGFAFNGMLAHYLVVDPTPEEEAPEEDAVQYTDAFETYWAWDAKGTVMTAYMKPAAFKAWIAGRKDLAGGY